MLDVTPDATLLEALMTLQGRLAHAAAEFAIEGVLGGTCVCHVNGRIVNAWAVLPPSADLVQFYCLREAHPWGSPVDTLGGMSREGVISSASSAPARVHGDRDSSQASQFLSAQHDVNSAGATASRPEPLCLPSLPAFYTCFNFLEQRLLKRKEPGWTDEDCRQDALRSVWFAVPRAIILSDPVEGYPLPQILVFKITDLNEHVPVVLAFLEDCEMSALHMPNPVGRLLLFPVEGLPEPQTLVTNRMLLSSHHSFALDLRAVGHHVTAVTVPHGQMVLQALHAIGEDTQQALQAIGVEQLPLTFYVNGARVGPTTIIPASTDVVCVIPGGHIGDGYGPPDVAGAIWGSDTTTSTTNGPATAAAGAAAAVTADGFLASEEDGVVPASTWSKGISRSVVNARIAQAQAAGLSGGPFTLFDELAGPIVLTRKPEWSRRQCVFHAVGMSRVSGPVGRLLSVPVPGWPEPQVLVSRAQLVLTHHAVVHLIAGEEHDPRVQQVPI